MDKHTICLLNDSFPPIIDGVANAVVNYAENIEKHHGHAVVVTPAVPGADDSGFPFPVVRYPSIDTRRLVGYVAGYPFSPETALRVREEKVELLHTHCPIASAILARSLREVVDAPLVLTYHTKYDIDIAKAVKSRLLQESAIRALVQNVNACDEVWVVSRGASVVCARRGGCSATFDELNKYFTISGMPIASSQYWNSVHGRAAGEAAMDAEGLQTMRTLARNMTFLMKSIALGRETLGLPEQEERVATHFIR